MNLINNQESAYHDLLRTYLGLTILAGLLYILIIAAPEYLLRIPPPRSFVVNGWLAALLLEIIYLIRRQDAGWSFIWLPAIGQYEPPGTATVLYGLIVGSTTTAVIIDGILAHPWAIAIVSASSLVWLLVYWFMSAIGSTHDLTGYDPSSREFYQGAAVCLTATIALVILSGLLTHYLIYA